MGWSYLDRKPTDVKRFLTEELNYEGDNDNLRFRRVQEVKIVNIRTAYAAVRQKSGVFDGVGAYVILLDYPRSKKSADKFGFKIMDESMGPIMSTCPKSILTKLSELPEGPAWDFARAWRRRCWSYHNLVAARAAKRKPGTILVRPSDGLTAEVCARDGAPHGVVLLTKLGTSWANDWTIDEFEVMS